MFTKKKTLKNPISVVRNPDTINKEYSDIVLKLGADQLELAAIYKAEINQENKKNEIAARREELLEKVEELSLEMNEAQKEIQRKAEEAKVAAPEEIKPIIPEVAL
jgi:outer membrane murein-binding lipoprotein Lpp